MTATIGTPQWQSDDEPTETTPTPVHEMSIASRQVVLSRKEYEEYEAMVDERDALKAKLADAELKAADRVEWQAVAMKVSNERDALSAKVGILKLALKEQEQRNQDLLGIRNALQNKLEEVQKQFGTCSVCGYVAWKDRDSKTQDCQFCAIRAKLDASERANAAFRNALDRLASSNAFDVPRAFTKDDMELILRMRFAKDTLSSDAGRDYVPKEQLARAQLCCELQKHQLDLAKPAADALVNAAWRQGMTDAWQLAMDWKFHPLARAILAARDAKKESTK